MMKKSNDSLFEMRQVLDYWRCHKNELKKACFNLYQDSNYSTEQIAVLVSFWNSFFSKVLYDASLFVSKEYDVSKVFTDDGSTVINKTMFVREQKSKVYKMLEDSRFQIDHSNPEEMRGLQPKIICFLNVLVSSRN